MAVGFLADAFRGAPGGMKAGEAFLTILTAAVLADGVEVDTERTEFEALIARSRTLRDYKAEDADKFDAKLRALKDQMREHKELIRLTEEAAASLVTQSDDRRIARSVFMHASDIVFADSRVPEREQKFLETLAVKLQLDSDEAVRMVRFIREKNEF